MSGRDRQAMLGPLCRYAAPPIAHHRTYSSNLPWVRSPWDTHLACVMSLGGPSPLRLFIFWGRRADVQWMPRYFFILVYPDRTIGDPRGTVLPSGELAIGTVTF